MKLTNLLTPKRTLLNKSSDSPIDSRKRAIQTLAQLLSDEDEQLDRNTVFEALIARERLGSTALGKGIAIPHSRIKDIEHPIAALLYLDRGIAFEASDNQAVDIFFALLVPEGNHDEHLQILATLAGLFSKEEFCNRIRLAKNSQELYETTTQFNG